MLPEWLEINNWSGFLSSPYGILVSRLWFPQLPVIQKYLIHFCDFFPPSFHCLDFAGIWVWLRQFGLWAAHQGMSTGQVLEVGVVALLGNVQDGPLLPGAPAGLLRVEQDFLHTCQVAQVNLSRVSHGVLQTFPGLEFWEIHCSVG